MKYLPLIVVSLLCLFPRESDACGCCSEGNEYVYSPASLSSKHGPSFTDLIGLSINGYFEFGDWMAFQVKGEFQEGGIVLEALRDKKKIGDITLTVGKTPTYHVVGSKLILPPELHDKILRDSSGPLVYFELSWPIKITASENLQEEFNFKEQAEFALHGSGFGACFNRDYLHQWTFRGPITYKKLDRPIFGRGKVTKG